MNEKICRLCLQTISSYNCQTVEEPLLKFLKLNINISKENVMCIECANCLRVFSNFTTGRANTEGKKLPLSDIDNGAKLDPEAIETTETEIKCSFCTTGHGREDIISLEKSKGNELMVNMLERYISETKLKNTKELLACETCLESLEGVSGIILKCLEVEEKISKYVELKGTDDKGQVELKDVQQFTVRPILKSEIESFGINEIEDRSHQVHEEYVYVMMTDAEIKYETEISSTELIIKTDIDDIAVEQTIRTCKDIVEYLTKYKFTQLSYDDKLFIKGLGVPRPDLSKTLIIQGKQSRSFHNTWYDKCNWLTGSLTLKKLFCWPCLLFSIQKDVWSKSGYDDLKNLSRSMNRHLKTQEHISCVCKLHLLGKQNIVNDTVRHVEIEKYNDSVRKNRDILSALIDVCLFLCNQDLVFRGHDESSESVELDNFKELVSLMGKKDNILRDLFDSNSVFSETSKTIQNELIESIAHVTMKNIDREISNAPFFSWQVDGTTDITGHSPLSVIIRYVRNGRVVERFVGFHDVSSGRTSEDLFQLLTKAFSKFDLENKLVAQTYDGAAVMAGHLYGLQAKIKSVAPQAFLTHCYAHSLNLVLSNACSSIAPVRIFFANLSGFSAFFSKSARGTNVLNTICGNRLLTTTPTRWNFPSGIVSTVYTYKTQLIEVLEYIIQSPDFDIISIREAVGLKKHLEDCNFLFFLEIFNLIFQQTDDVFSILQNKFTDISCSRVRLQALISKLKDFRDQDPHFNKIFKNISLDHTESKRRKLSDITDPKTRFKQYFCEIIDTVSNQIEIRFLDMNELVFFDLLKVHNFQSNSKLFPQELFDSLLKCYKFFDSIQLKSELSVLYCDKLLGSSNTPFEMLEYMANCELDLFMPELYKLLCLIVTIPVTSASADTIFSRLKRIKTFTQSTVGQHRLSNMSIISINKDLIGELRQDSHFYDDVIDNFSDKKNHRIPLQYKR